MSWRDEGREELHRAEETQISFGIHRHNVANCVREGPQNTGSGIEQLAKELAGPFNQAEPNCCFRFVKPSCQSLSIRREYQRRRRLASPPLPPPPPLPPFRTPMVKPCSVLSGRWTTARIHTMNPFAQVVAFARTITVRSENHSLSLSLSPSPRCHRSQQSCAPWPKQRALPSRLSQPGVPRRRSVAISFTLLFPDVPPSRSFFLPLFEGSGPTTQQSLAQAYTGPRTRKPFSPQDAPPHAWLSAARYDSACDTRLLPSTSLLLSSSFVCFWLRSLCAIVRPAGPTSDSRAGTDVPREN